MDTIYQGFVLMIAGMGIVYCFLTALIVVTLISMKGIARFDSLLPQDAPKKKPATTARAIDDEANIALAIAVAING